MRRDQRGLVEQVALDELDAVQQVLDPLDRVGAGPAGHPDDAVALLEQELGEIGAVLAGDAGDQRCLSHAHEYREVPGEPARRRRGTTGWQPRAGPATSGSPVSYGACRAANGRDGWSQGPRDDGCAKQSDERIVAFDLRSAAGARRASVGI